MKKAMIFLLMMMFAFAAHSATAQQEAPAQANLQDAPVWSSAVIPQCSANISQNICIESAPMIWNVEVANEGSEGFSVNGITVVDADGVIIAQVRANASIPPGQSATAQLQGIVPPPTRSSTLYYSACYLINGRQDCEARQRSMIVTPVSDIECFSNQSCPSRRCANFKCVQAEEKSFSKDDAYSILIILLILYGISVMKKNSVRKKEMR